MRRLLTLACLALAALPALLYLTSRPAPAGFPTPTSKASAAEPHAPEPVPSEQATPSRIARAEAPPDAAAASTDAGAPRPVLSGVVRLEGGRTPGRLSQGESIRLEFEVDTGRGSARPELVELVLARTIWQLEPGPSWPTPLRVRWVGATWAGERVEIVEPRGWHTIEGTLNRLVVRRAAGPTLEVLDGASGAPLNRVTVRMGFAYDPAAFRHPGPEDTRLVIASDVPSPIPIAARHHRRGIAVWSPGYAWAYLSLDRVDPSEWSLRLVPGGDLTVALAGHAPPADAQVVVRPSGDGSSVVPVGFPAAAGAPVEVRGLRVGRYLVSLERGESDRPLVLGGPVEVELAAGQHATIALNVSPEPERMRATLAGVLVLDEAWALDSFDLHAIYRGVEITGDDPYVTQRSQDMPSVGPGRWRFEFEDLVVGTYQLALLQPPYHVDVELRPGGTEDVELRLPAPVTLGVATVDDVSGERVQSTSLTVQADGSTLSDADSYEPEDPGWFVVRVPDGVPLRLFATAPGYSMSAELHTARAGPFNRRSLPMYAGKIVYLRFKGTERGYLDIPATWSPRDALGPAGRAALDRAVRDEDGYRLYFTTLRDCELTPPAFPGYRADPVTLPLGSTPGATWQVVRLEPVD